MAETQPPQQAQKQAAKPSTAERKPPAALHAMRVQSAEYARNTWLIYPEVGTVPDDLLAPDYWTNIAHQLRQRDHIEAWSEDLKWYAELLVLEVGRNWAKVHLRENSVEEFSAFDPIRANMILPGHTIEYAGLYAKWRVKREKDGAILKDKCETDGEAIGWLTEHAKSLRT